MANTPLTQKLGLEDFSYVAIDVEGPHVKLIFLVEPTYHGVLAHRLQYDGGKGTGARGTFIARSVAGAMLPVGRYQPTKIGRGFVSIDVSKPEP